MAKPPLYVPIDYEDTDPDAGRPLDRFEIEIQLAIAQFVIKRVAGTAAGKEIFDGLISRYEDRFPHHKLLANYLTSPEHMETSKAEAQDDSVALERSPGSVASDSKDI